VQTLAWFGDNPMFSMQKYNVMEEPLNQMPLAGAVLQDCTGNATIVAPTEFKLKIVGKDRTQLLAFENAKSLTDWYDFLSLAVKGELPSLPAPPPSPVADPGRPTDLAQVLLKSAPGWRTFQYRYVFLDASECVVRYFDARPPTSLLQQILGA